VAADSSPVSRVTGPSSFSFGGYTWQTHAWNAPPVGNTNGNVGTFAKANVAIGSELVLTLKQTRSGSKILSSGAEVGTTRTFTYGTFEFTSRVVNVASGSVASGFLYATNSVTEIDMEQVGNKPGAVDCTNWKGISNFQDTQVTGNTHAFKIVWRPTYVNWYVDGKLVVSHTRARCRALRPRSSSICGEPIRQAGEAQPPRERRGTCTSATSSTRRDGGRRS
jgi:beta-glucanase (GH16 family)